MEEDRKDELAIRRLAPNAIIVPVDGRDVIVPTDRGENARMNMLAASIMRTLLLENIKSYKEKEVTLTPKELSDLTSALKNISQTSSEIYDFSKSGDNPLDGIKVGPKITPRKSVSFSKLKPIDINEQSNPPGAGCEGPTPDVSGQAASEA